MGDVGAKSMSGLGRRRFTERLGYSSMSLTELVEAVRSGDDWAWQALVERLSKPVMGVLSTFNVDPHLRNDAAAETWKTLFEHLDRVREPERLCGWAGVVAANHLRRILRSRNRFRDHEDIDRVVYDSAVAASERDTLIESETHALLAGAVGRLSVKEQAIIRGRALTDDPIPLVDLAHKLGIPVGSIGPTFGRSVAKLRQDKEVREFLEIVE